MSMPRRTNAASIGLVKDYLQRRIAAEKEETDSVRSPSCSAPGEVLKRVQDRALIASYRTETSKKQREIADLTDPNTPRVFQVTRCSSCGGQLELVRILSALLLQLCVMDRTARHSLHVPALVSPAVRLASQSSLAGIDGVQLSRRERSRMPELRKGSWSRSRNCPVQPAIRRPA